jgi:hypothetical protein
MVASSSAVQAGGIAVEVNVDIAVAVGPVTGSGGVADCWICGRMSSNTHLEETARILEKSFFEM